MIIGEHTYIRTADPDDAEALLGVYLCDKPRSFMMDARREFQYPTLDELRQLLGRKEIRTGALYVVEDKRGIVRGCVTLKTPMQEVSYSELVVVFLEPGDYMGALADETMAFVENTAFTLRKLRKIVTQCLETEEDYRELLVRNGYSSDGCQREVVFAEGRYLDLETFTRYNEQFEEHVHDVAAPSAAPVTP